LGEITPAVAADLLKAAGLNHELVDQVEVAADLAARIAVSNTLDALLERGARPDPISFDPQWPR
jgi:hypothetical protein